MSEDSTTKTPPAEGLEHPRLVRLSDRYDWQSTNRLSSFDSWEDEITHAKSEGYELVPPDYVIPHWSVAMKMGDKIPKLYVMREQTFGEFTNASNRPARDHGYPLFFKTNKGS